MSGLIIFSFIVAISASLWYGVSLQEARTMRKTLEDLYYGNITPNAQDMAPHSELRRATDRVTRFENQLMERLDEAEIGRASCRERV